MISQIQSDNSGARQVFRKKLREGELDDKEIEIDVKATGVGVDIMTPPGMEEMASQLQDMFTKFGQDKKKKRKLPIRDAYKILIDEEAARLISDDEVKLTAIRHVEDRGIVFLDEIDKVCRRENAQGADVSREGVQRDLLPLIEGPPYKPNSEQSKLIIFCSLLPVPFIWRNHRIWSLSFKGDCPSELNWMPSTHQISRAY